MIHALKKSLIQNKLKNKTILVSVSSGLDSMVLLRALKCFQKSFHLNLKAIYVHHGDSKEKSISSYRKKAQKFLQDDCKKMEIPFLTIKSKESLKSEADLREFRYDEIKKILKKEKCDVVAVAHHADDLLETRLIRLIRGVGPQGLEAMKELHDGIWRPFLKVSKAALARYAEENQVKFREDPSNKDASFFRNWLRTQWLPQLESYKPGSLNSLARSIESFVASDDAKIAIQYPDLLSEEGISRSHLISLSKTDQRRALAEFLKLRRLKNYTSSQIDEILKRLDSPKKDLTFKIMGCDWTVDTKRITCRQPEHKS